MAVSGRKTSDFQGSISHGSAECFDQNCDTCLNGGMYVEAHGYCVDCEEHLCKNCFLYHQRTKALKHHQLLDKDNMDKRPLTTRAPASLTEKCPVHSNEIIKFFCPEHAALGCNDCITLEHRTCKIDYIPEKCSGIGDSKVYRDIMKDIDDKIREADQIAREANDKDQEIDKFYDTALKDIDTFEKEIIKRIEELKKQIKREAQVMNANNKQAVQKALESCTKFSTGIKQVQTNMISTKASNQEGQLYILLTRAKTILKSNEIGEVRQSLEVNTQYTFECNKDLDNFLSNTSTLGRLINTEKHPVSLTKKLTFHTLKPTGDINVKTRSDDEDCSITGCAYLSHYKVVLADWNNCKIKVVDTKRKIVEREKQLDHQPFGITKLPQDQIAISLPHQNEIIILTSESKLKTKRHIRVKPECWGITYHDGCLYVVCTDPYCVLILDLQGSVKHTISLDTQQGFSFPWNIVYSKDNNLLYISDFFTNIIASMTLQGKITTVYTNEDLSTPRGMVVLEDGSLLFCYRNNGTIHHISGDLKQGRTVADGLVRPVSICISYGEIGIGCEGFDKLKVFSCK